IAGCPSEPRPRYDRALQLVNGSVICVIMRLVSNFPPLDATDDAILDQLTRDGRMSNIDLAAAVHLSPSSCLRRVRGLEERGVIRGYRAEIDPASVGRGFEVIVHVELGRKDRETVEQFEAEIAAFDEVVECRRMFGIPDYLI